MCFVDIRYQHSQKWYQSSIDCGALNIVRTGHFYKFILVKYNLGFLPLDVFGNLYLKIHENACVVEDSMSTRSITLEIEELKLAKPKPTIGTIYPSVFQVSDNAKLSASVLLIKDFIMLVCCYVVGCYVIMSMGELALCNE